MSELGQFFELEVSPSKMEAMIIQHKKTNGELEVTRQKILDFINEHGITYGIDELAIAKLLKGTEVGVRLKVASGKEPKKGKSAYIKPIAFKERGREVQSLQNMNLKDFLEIPSVRIDDQVATKVSATAGENGFTVYGEEVPAKAGNDIPLTKGKNTRLVEEEQALYSLIDGQISIDKYTVHVHPTFEVKGDLTLETGNISFVGNVTIHGNVPAGFKVDAGGDIRVSGTVEAATLRAGGSIYIGAGIVGQNRSLLEADGNLQTTFINEGNAVVGGSIEVVQAILHSNCSSGRSIICTQGKGLVVGGSLSAKQSIQVNEAGNEMYTATKLFIGMSQKLVQQQKEREEEQRLARENLLKLGKLLKAFLEKEKQKGELHSREKISKLKVLTSFQKAKQVMDELNELRKFDEEEEGMDDGFILVKGTLYPNVTVHFGKYRKKIFSAYNCPKISLMNHEIVISTSYN